MSRLPIVADDLDNWGTILNDFLLQLHNADGTLRDETITALKINAADVAAIRTKLDIQDTAAVEALVDDLSGVTDAVTARSNLSVPSQAEVASAIAAAVADYLLKSGGTMTGKIVLDGAPTADLHAATKKYVDDSVTVSPSHDHVGGDGAPIPQAGLSDVFGSWTSRNVTTVYQAATDGFLSVYGDITDGSGSASVTIYSDSNASPSTVIHTEADQGSPTGRIAVSICIPIKKDEYYKTIVAATSSSLTLKFMPLGS